MAQTESGLSIRAYYRERGISERGFNWWRRELRLRKEAKANPAFCPPATDSFSHPHAIFMSTITLR
jgi:hypothetical protein